MTPTRDGLTGAAGVRQRRFVCRVVRCWKEGRTGTWWEVEMPAEGVKWARRWPEARAAMRQEEERWLVLIVDPIMAGRRDVGHRLQEGRQVYVRFTMYGRLCWSTMRAAQPTSWWRSGSVEPAPRLEPERAGD